MEAMQRKQDFLVQEYITGQEVTCPTVKLMGQDVIGAPMEIIYDGPIYDFKIKNKTLRNGLSIPPRDWITSSQEGVCNAVRKAAVLSETAFAIRLDMRVNKNGVYVIEGNAEPNLSKNDFVSRSMNHIGFSYPDLVLGLLGNSEHFCKQASQSHLASRKLCNIERKLKI